MFAENLLESSATRKRKRWPMATAFTVQTIIAAIVIIVPLLSTGVIPLSARMPIFTPIKEVTPPEPPRTKPEPLNQGSVVPSGPTAVVLENNNKNVIRIGDAIPTTPNEQEVKPGNHFFSNNKMPGELIGGGTEHGPVVKPETKRIISVLSEAQLVNRVEPVYPRPAILAGVQGQVKLHAIIARDGRIVSLNIMSGHPLLVRAAEDAVSQWRYRPYYLNGEAVEVETFITVNFRREGR